MSILRSIAKLPDGAKTDEAILVLKAWAEKFLIGGGLVTLHVYAELDDEERMALYLAGQTLRKTLAADIGISAQGPAGAAAVIAPIDGGAAATRLALEGALARAEKP